MSLSPATKFSSIDPEVLREFSLASGEYKRACSQYTKIRLATDHPRATDEDIVLHHRAKAEFREACRTYTAARLRYISVVRVTLVEIPRISNQDLALIVGNANSRDVERQMRQSNIASSISPEEFEAITSAARLRAGTGGKDTALSVSASNISTVDREETPLPAIESGYSQECGTVDEEGMEDFA
jgi:hypothetical protein